MKKISIFILMLSIKLYSADNSLSFFFVGFGVGVENHFPLKEKFETKKMFQTANIDYGMHWLIGSRTKFGISSGGLFLLGPEAKFVDLFNTGQIIFYPFQEYVSIVGSIGLSPTFFILNNISFITSAKLSIDIPIVREHYISISGGVFYRGFIPMIDYIDFDSYRQNLSSYFVGLEYKFLIKAKNSPIKKYNKDFKNVA